jgi:hypothetical protein
MSVASFMAQRIPMSAQEILFKNFSFIRGNPRRNVLK